LDFFQKVQCCGSKSVTFGPLDLGSWMGNKSGSGSRIQNEQPGSYFLELRNHFLGLKYLNSLMQIRDEKKSDPGDPEKHPGSATLKKYMLFCL
jgi:hypothetical protein